MYKLCAQARHLRDSLNQVIGHLIAEAQPFPHMLVQRNGTLPTPCALAFFQFDLIVLLVVGAGCLSADLYGGVGDDLAVADLPDNRAVLVPYLKQTIDLIALDAHLFIVVDRIVVDFSPGVVCALGFVAAADRKIHRHNAAVIIDGVEILVFPQGDAVDLLHRFFFHRLYGRFRRGRLRLGSGMLRRATARQQHNQRRAGQKLQ